MVEGVVHVETGKVVNVKHALIDLMYREDHIFSLYVTRVNILL